MPTTIADARAPVLMPPKDPDSAIDYAWDWSDFLSADSDTISSFTVTAIDSGITVDSSSEASNIVTAFLSGGTPGRSYRVRCRLVATANGRANVDQTIIVPVSEH